MSEELTKESYLKFITLSSNEQLQQVGVYLYDALQNTPEDSPEYESIGIMLALLYREVEFREIEPLWRKTKRFALRNSDTFKKVGKVAAAVGAGVLLGGSISG